MSFISGLRVRVGIWNLEVTWYMYVLSPIYSVTVTVKMNLNGKVWLSYIGQNRRGILDMKYIMLATCLELRDFFNLYIIWKKKLKKFDYLIYAIFGCIYIYPYGPIRHTFIVPISIRSASLLRSWTSAVKPRGWRKNVCVSLVYKQMGRLDWGGMVRQVK